MSRWSRHSARAERIRRSAKAFSDGERQGVRTISTPSAANIAPKIEGRAVLLPEDTAALKACRAQVTAAYEDLSEGVAAGEPDGLWVSVLNDESLAAD